MTDITVGVATEIGQLVLFLIATTLIGVGTAMACEAVGRWWRGN